MPNLNLFMSMPTILLTLLWFFDPGIKRGISNFTLDNPATWMAGLFLLHILWLFNTSDWDYATKDLRIKLPLLVLALNPGTVRLSRKEEKLVFAALGLGIWIATLVGYYLYYSEGLAKLNPRFMVPDISHIRLSLMMILFLGAGFYFFRELENRWRWAVGISMANAVVFLYLLQSLTAFSVLVVAGIVTVGVFRFGRLSKGIRYTTVLVALVLVVTSGVSLYNYYQSYFATGQDTIPLMDETPSGNPYNHYDTLLIENGNYVFANISELELVQSWNERSELQISYDPMVNSEVIARIVRYLTSKGLPKNREAVMSLSDEEIGWIEKGYPTKVHATKSGLQLRMHMFLNGVHHFIASGRVEGSSFFQRLFFWKVGWSLIEDRPFLGSGTGDVKKDFEAAYDDFSDQIDPDYRLRAHNQYLTFLISFGILGFLYFLFFVFKLFRAARSDALFFYFAVIAALSFLTEDTLETQAGVTFIAFFVALFSSRRS